MAELIINGETKSITAEELQSQSITKIIMSNNAQLSITTELCEDVEVDIMDSDIGLTYASSPDAYGIYGSIKDSIIRALSDKLQFPVHNTLIIDNCQFYKNDADITSDEDFKKAIGAQYANDKLVLKNLHDVWLNSKYFNYAGLIELENCSGIYLSGCRARVTDDFLNQLALSNYVYLMPTLLEDGEYGYDALELSKARSAVGTKLTHVFYTSLTEADEGGTSISDPKYPSDELITEEWLQEKDDELHPDYMPERIHHDGGRVFTISGSLACIPVQCFIKDNDNFLDSVYLSELNCNYPVSSWRNGNSRRCAMSTNTAKLKLQLAPNYQCEVSKIIDTDFNSSTEIFRSGNLFKFVEIEGYMGDSINSLSIVAIPTAFIDGSVKAVTGDAVIHIDGDIIVQRPYFIELDESVLIQAVAREDIDGTIICAVNAKHIIDGEVIVEQVSESIVNGSIDIKAIQIYDLNGDLGCAQPVTNDISFEGSLIVPGLMKIITGEVNVQPVVSAELVGTLIINQETLDLDGALTVVVPIYKDIDGTITLNIARAEINGWFEIPNEGGGWI